MGHFGKVESRIGCRNTQEKVGRLFGVLKLERKNATHRRAVLTWIFNSALARWSDNKSGSAGDACSGPRVKKTAKSVSAPALCNRALVWRLAFVPHLLR